MSRARRRACLAASVLACLAAGPAAAQGERQWVDPPAPGAASPTVRTIVPPPPPAAVAPVPQPPPPPPPPAPAAAAPAPGPAPAAAATADPAPAPAARSREASDPKRRPRVESARSAPAERAAPPPILPRQAEPRIVEEPRAARGATPLPSFNCRYARSSVERAICADPVLAAKDRRMALLYEQAGGSRHGPVDITQFRWLSARNACARARAIEACVDRIYDARIAELSGAGR
jgi:hypothetical protein